MLDDNALDELKNVDRIKTATKELRDRMEDHFDYYRNKKFEIPKKEGEWESFTSNRASTDANKTINTLASARLSLKILLADENEKQRKNLSKTERFPYGLISLRDDLITGIPEALMLQQSLSWHAVVRGWIGLLLYLFEEDDGKNGAVRPHIPVLDIFNTYWITGSKGLLKLYMMRYASAEDVKDQFGEDLKPDTQGRVKLWNVWDKESFGTSGEGEWLGGIKKHDLGHIPALILPVGSTPFIQSERHTNTIRDVGISFATDNERLYDIESRMGSYFLTMAGEAAHAPKELHYDSSKGGKPIELEGGQQKGSYINIDEGKGQSVKSTVTAEMKRDAYTFFEYLQGQESRGGHTSIAFGESPFPSTASGTNLLVHQSLTNIKPPQNAMERAYAWLAEEGISQYVSGDFGEMEIQGIDGSFKRFKMTVKPKDIKPEWKFEAKLLPDMPQDDMANMGMAVQAVEAELLSPETSRDKYNLVDDTDLEQQKIDRHKIYQFFNVLAKKVASAALEDGDEETARDILSSLEEMELEKEKGVASQPGSKTPVSPVGAVKGAQNAPPEDANARPSALERFRSRFGGG